MFSDDKGIRYKGVNKIIGNYKVEEDWDAILNRTAEKRGVEPTVLRAEWDANRDLSLKRGVIYHEQQEATLKALNKPNIFFTPKDLYKYQDCKLLDNSAYVEKILWDEEEKVFGIADYIMVKDKKVYLKDYKTNSKIDFESFKSKRFTEPISHLEDCNFNEYSLQCSFYMWMILRNNPEFEFGQMKLEHIIFDGEEPIDKIEYNVKYLKHEIETILKTINNKQNEQTFINH